MYTAGLFLLPRQFNQERQSRAAQGNVLRDRDPGHPPPSYISTGSIYSDGASDIGEPVLTTNNGNENYYSHVRDDGDHLSEDSHSHHGEGDDSFVHPEFDADDIALTPRTESKRPRRVHSRSRDLGAPVRPSRSMRKPSVAPSTSPPPISGEMREIGPAASILSSVLSDRATSLRSDRRRSSS